MRDNTIIDLFRKNFEQIPDKTALVLIHPGEPDRHLTCREFFQYASAYAEMFNSGGIRQGEVVILILQHGLDLTTAFAGAILHGAVPSIMPFLTEKLLPERYRADLASLIAITKPAAILTYPEFEDEVRSAHTNTDSVRKIFLSSDVGSAINPDFDRFVGMQQKPDDIVLLQHSSGTTGLQKGVALSHRSVLNQLDSYTQALEFNDQDIVVSWLPLYHDMGLIAGYLMPLMSGTPLVLLSPFDWVKAPHKLMQTVSKYKGTLSWLPNFAYNFCAQKIRDRHLEGVDLSSWRLIINCSEPVRWEGMQAFLERFKPFGLKPTALSTSYAMAENVFGVTQNRPGTPLFTDLVDQAALQSEWIALPAINGKPTLNLVSSGKPIPGTEVRVLGKGGVELSDRKIGEVVIKSDCMLTGYYHRPEDTKKAFHEGWFLTGDYGYKIGDELFVTGRKKDLIIVGGKNIYPSDLEVLAMQTPGVHAGRVVAFGIFNDDTGTEEIAIVAEVDYENMEHADNITEGIRQNVSRGSAVVPRYVHLVNCQWIVKTSSGKTARLANRDKFIQEMKDGKGV